MTPALAFVAWLIVAPLACQHGGACIDRVIRWAHRQKETRHG